MRWRYMAASIDSQDALDYLYRANGSGCEELHIGSLTYHLHPLDLWMLVNQYGLAIRSHK